MDLEEPSDPVNIPGFCNGALIGWPSVAIPILQGDDSPLGHPMTNEGVALVATLICLTALISIFFANAFIARFGSKIIGYVTGITLSLHWIIVIATRSTAWLYVARSIAGFACACGMAMCPQYVKEISQDEIRGTLGVFFIIMFNTGYLYVNGVAAFLSYNGIAIASLIPCVLFILCFLRMPETPVYLLMKGKTLEASKSLQSMRGKNADISEEMALLKDSLSTSSDNASMTLKEMLTDRGTRRGLFIVVILSINSQLSGIYIFLTYLGSIFLESGSHLSHITASVIVAVLQLLGTIASSYLVENKGRRFLIFLSNGSMASCLVALGIYFYLKQLEVDVSSFSWLPVTSLSVYMVGMAVGLGPLPFVILTEMCLPAATKVASTLGCVGILLPTAILSMSFKSLSILLGLHVCYFSFAVICTLGIVFTYFFVPETKGRPVKEIHLELSGKKNSSGDKRYSIIYSPASINDNSQLNETTA
ncbi:facilitated trehalose transporter Tret1 isoform X2 [Anabrus simplex]|uniref:facilitated trehalose transporter Tret1 isoform X2 n=1 Tax=Anabrus simplex TaxID=316456 RepID=UPI0035A33350